MIQVRRQAFYLLVSVCSFVLVSTYSFGDDSETGLDAIPFLLDEPELMEPIIVPEPENGSPWWYTPSRKAQLFKHRYQSAIRQLHQTQNKEIVGTKQGEDMRLPGDIIPIDYKVRMLPFVELIGSGNYTTDGYVEILVQCVRATKSISINSVELDINTTSISVSQCQ